ncbi:AAA family ATPase [Amycolatopsis jiangsuensis]|uniref:DNA-binding transcriptional regulator YhcF (GntR family) n=1 Tax=Amycolatopsis jiangsuensis TaxID=1181879 RepID=A0A840J1E7_9PSEU|nr:GntR family transcriptional regulator [Amycolatopsis jiangsuensis]MBB4687218.1 DNA-binding transcriptional regulator YhcF (GntR family) [Amycolatopsis jiangsuensis]
MSRPRSSLTRSEPLAQQIARNVENDIHAGRLRHGQRLASSRELAQEWDVSVFTINEAMGLLAKKGLVVSKTRSARTVNAPNQEVRREVTTSVPQVLMIGGYAGSGKTELGRVLTRETGWAMLDKDSLTRFVVEAALEVMGLSRNDRESETYLTKIRPAEYTSLLEAMTENVQVGNSVIVTAPFLREFSSEEWLNRQIAACRKLGANLTIVWVYCDEDTMHTYVKHRDAPRDGAKLANWGGYMEGVNLEFRPPVPHVVIDNSVAGELLVDQARRLVAQVTEEVGK